MKKTIIFVSIAILIGIALAFIYNYYQKNIQQIHYCKSNFSEAQKLTLYSLEPNVENFNCRKKVAVYCPNCEIIGNNYGYEYNNQKLIALYSSNKKEVILYDTEKENTFDTIENVIFKKGYLHREKNQIALYNDDKLFGFIFPNFCKGTNNCETLYKLENKKIINNNDIATYEIVNFKNYFTLEDKGHPLNTSYQNHYIITIKNGIIPVYTSNGLNLYNVNEEKYLYDFQKGEFFNTQNGFIFYDSGWDSGIYNVDKELKFYDSYGKFIFSNKSNAFGYDAIELMNIINEDLVLIIGYSKKDGPSNEGIILVDHKGNLIYKIPLSKNDIKNDIKSKLKENENYDKLEFPNDIYNYYSSSNSYYMDKNKITISFAYNNNYYHISSYVKYDIDINTKKIINREIS